MREPTTAEPKRLFAIRCLEGLGLGLGVLDYSTQLAVANEVGQAGEAWALWEDVVEQLPILLFLVYNVVADATEVAAGRGEKKSIQGCDTSSIVYYFRYN